MSARLCLICGRPPHPCDDGKCVPPDATALEKMKFLGDENARLRELASEMLAALQTVVRVADRATVEFEMARAAIAKATGDAS